jgi:hypothetical protein
MTRLIIVLSAIVGVIAVVAVSVAVYATARVASDDTKIAIADAKIRELTVVQKQGRRLALGVTCAAVSAVSEAGRATIANAMPLPPGVEALLVAHGFPSFRERKAAARIASVDYVRRISAKVEDQVGRKGDHLVNADGTLNCHRLELVARAR